MESDRTQKQIIGALGEDIACRFIKDRGFEIITRNYRKKFGEIDIIAKKANRLHFLEVKTVSRDNLGEAIPETDSILSNSPGDCFRPKTNSEFVRSNYPVDSFRPEDNVHPWKLKRLSRAIKVYLAEKRLGDETDWQFNVVTVLLDVKSKIAKVKILYDIIL